MRDRDLPGPDGLRLLKAQLPQRLKRLRRRGERLVARAWDVNTLALLERDAGFLATCCRSLEAGELADLLDELGRSATALLDQAEVPDAAQAGHVARLLADIGAARTPRALSFANAAGECVVPGATHENGFPLLVAPPADYWKRFGAAPAFAAVDLGEAAEVHAQAPRAPAADTERSASAAAAPAAPDVGVRLDAYHLGSGDALSAAVDVRLRARGYALTRFAAADALITAIDAMAPSLVIVDAAFLRAVDAIGARVKQLRKNTERAPLLVALSPPSDVDRRLHAIRVGCDALIEEPADADEVDRRIAELAGVAHDDPYRIMIIEDDASQTVFAESILRKAGMRTLAVADALDTLDELERFDPDLILMDLHMPGCDGIDLTALIRQREAFVATPIVFLSGDHNSDKHFEALDAGGDDFLSKPIRPRHLISAVTNRVSRARRLRRREAAPPATAAPTAALPLHTLLQRAAAHLAMTDAHARSGGLLAFALADLENLRARLGDTRAHELGAAVEAHVAAHGGPHSLVAHLDAGRFLMFEPDCAAGLLEAHALTLRERVANESFAAIAAGARVDVDIGVCAFVAGAERVEDMRDAAFAAIAEQRKSGRSGVVIARDVHASDNELAERIRFALDGIGFQLVFQPIVSLRGEAGQQFQALLRLQGDDQKVYAAADVIPAAERAGLAGAVDGWVLENAIALLAPRVRGGSVPRLFVSVSLDSVRAAAGTQPFKDLLEAARVPANAIVLELRATQVAADFDAFLAWAAATKALGAGIAVSALETGSLAERILAADAVDYVKVAPRYLRLEQGAMRAELGALIEQAQAAGKRVVVPRVEDARVAAMLWTTGADYIQGNFVQQAGQEFAFDFEGSSI